MVRILCGRRGIVLRRATDEEWAWIQTRVREEVRGLNWAREAWSGSLLRGWQQDGRLR